MDKRQRKRELVLEERVRGLGRREGGRREGERKRKRENRGKNEYTNQNFLKTSQYKDKKRKYF